MKQKFIFIFVTGIIASTLVRINLVEGANFIEWMIYFMLLLMFLNDKTLDK